MSENTNVNADANGALVEDELTALKARADLMKIKYHPSIGLDALRDKVNEAISSTDKKEEETKVQEVIKPKVETENETRLRLKNEALKLHRVRVMCMNPAKKEWQGEIFTVGNALIGTVKKYVPFNNDEGWHVPNIILNVMQERQCQVFVTVSDGRGNKVRKGKLIKEFAIEFMPDLTEKELAELAHRQAATKSIE